MPLARAFERKKRRSASILSLERRSPLRDFFTGGVEYDDRVDLARVSRLIADFGLFRRIFGVPGKWGNGVELKLRRLGRHRADGLYYPDQAVLVVDLASTRSFAHEFGHLLDYGARSRPRIHGLVRMPSDGEEFTPFHAALLERMRRHEGVDPRISRRRGRLSWAYFASRSECFARAFEQCVSESLPEPCSLAHGRDRYRSDPLFFDRVPPDLLEYFRSVLDPPAEDGSAARN